MIGDDARARQYRDRISADSGWRAFVEAIRQLANGKSEEALAAATNAKSSLEHPVALWVYALAVREADEPARAVDIIDTMLAGLTELNWRTELSVIKAAALGRAGDEAGQRATLEAAVREYDASPRANLALASILFRAGEFTRARELSTRAVALAPASWPARSTHLQVHLDGGDTMPPDWLIGQVDEFGGAVETAPWETWMLANSLRARRDFERAFQLYVAVYTKSPESAIAPRAHFATLEMLAYSQRPGARDDAAAMRSMESFLKTHRDGERVSPAMLGNVCYWALDAVSRGAPLGAAMTSDELATCIDRLGERAALQRKANLAFRLSKHPDFATLVKRFADEVIGTLGTKFEEHKPHTLLAFAHAGLAELAARSGDEENARRHGSRAVGHAGSWIEVKVRRHVARGLAQAGRNKAAVEYVEGCLQHPDCETTARELFRRERTSPTGDVERYIADAKRALFKARERKVVSSALAARERIPDIPLGDASGARVDLPETKSLILHFWETSCQPCVDEMPAFAEFVKSLDPTAGHRVISVNLSDPPEAAASWMREHGYSFPVYFAGDDFSIRGVPMTWFVDREKRLVFEVYGASEPTWLTREFVWRAEFVLSHA